jgi:hypothetical protein
VDVVLKRCLGERRALEATVAEQITLEAERGQPRQCRQDARPVIRVGRVQLEIEQRTMLVAYASAQSGLEVTRHACRNGGHDERC